MNNTSRKLYHIYVCGLFAILIVSCATSGVGNGKQDDIIGIKPFSDTQYEYRYTTNSSLAFSSSIKFPETLGLSTVAEMNKCLQEIRDKPEEKVMSEFGKLAPQMKSWQEVHKAAQECIAKTEGTFGAFHVHQMVATTMLNVYFLLQKPTPEVQQAVGYYMDVLIRHKNYLDPNVKAAILPMLIGYWSPEKIIDVAQKNFEAITYNEKAKELWLQDFYKKRSAELAKQSPEQYSQISSTQIQSKIQEDLLSKINMFPKRSKPFPNPIKDFEEYDQLRVRENPENVAILALLAQGAFSPNNKK